jgi:hypothetical protein
MSEITPLASSQINHDHLSVELVEPDGMPAVVRIVWPPKPTVFHPRRFPAGADTAARLFASAVVKLAQLRREGRIF